MTKVINFNSYFKEFNYNMSTTLQKLKLKLLPITICKDFCKLL